ncbi:hypothetical protein N1851_016961 [Merluccius polli]|uniref:Uncharacterized protein n=1 Tax=Merluccius polli TaxID=89951 RepID=A0AA47MQW6_MERPO|nr:hypothetical protein N1851_016961 [Merluccius polli]
MAGPGPGGGETDTAAETGGSAQVDQDREMIVRKDLAVQLESVLEKKAPDILTEHQQTLSTSSRKKLEHFYDPVSHKGFIEIKLRSLEVGQQRYHKRKLSCSAASAAQPSVDEDPSEWLTVIKRMKPSPENMGPIKTAME